MDPKPAAGFFRPLPPTVRWEGLAPDLLDEETVLFLLRFGVRLGAGRFGLSERTFRRRFQSRGLRLADLLADRRRALTFRLLSGALPVTTVALRLGFSSAQTFARYFWREFGATATELRSRLAKGEGAPFGRSGHLCPPFAP